MGCGGDNDLGQLTRENNEVQGKTYVYTYDNGGNRTSKTTYAYTIGSVNDLTPTETQTYSYYSTGAWGDQLSLTQTNGMITAMFSYDAIGNPVAYNGYLMTWDGRRLMTANGSGKEISYAYNADGLRTRKTVNGVEHIYTLEGSRIVSESWGDNLLIYLYDESGAPIGMQYRQDGLPAYDFYTFYFEKNIFGDIIAVYNESGTKVLSYTYDAWGNHTTNWHYSIGTNLYAQYNPFRYRGYYYDTETGLYYLQSRYYNPQWGRFLNADGYINANGDLIGFNMYAYCSNNPVMLVDSMGNRAMRVVALDGSFGTTQIESAVHADSDGIGILVDYKNNPPDHPDYRPPKKGHKKVKLPNGRGYGWEDKKGGIWVWTPDMHGGEGWTVNEPNGDHWHGYPGGGKRTHMDLFPSNNTSVGLVGVGVILSLYLMLNDLSGVGVADDSILLVSGACVFAGLGGIGDTRICPECGEVLK